MMTMQLELGLDRRSKPNDAARRQQRRQRARWWFDYMRRIVDATCSRTPRARPEQTYLTLGHPCRRREMV